MEVVLAKTAGFCYGVNRAVELAENQNTNDKKTVTLGPLIHNPNVVENLKSKGIYCVNDEKEVEAASKVIIRTHGVSKEILSKLEEKSCEIVDATCPFVKKIHNYVEKYSKMSYNIIVTGYENHPEVDGILGWCENATVISSVKDAENYNSDNEKILVVSQTTFEKQLFEDITAVIKEKYRNAEIINTICSATAERQAETLALSKECDMFVVIGGKNSSNTNRLYDIASKYCKKVLLVENVSELNTDAFENAQKIGVTAGASTPAYIIKEVVKMLEEKELNFEEALENTLKPLNTGDIVKGTIIKITPKEASVDLGTKHDGVIPEDQVSLDPLAKIEDVLSVGQEVEAFVVRVNDKDGYVTLSLKKLQMNAAQQKIADAFENGENVTGTVTEIVNGGMIAYAYGQKVFIPGKLASLKRNQDLNEFLKKEVTFRIIDMDRRRRKLVGSVRTVLNEERKAKLEAFWAEIEEGKEVKGTVKSVTNFGAFVDIGGVDGLVHISELSWNSYQHPSEIVKVGDEITVKILSFDKETGKISLGYKKEEDNPWVKIKDVCSEGDTIKCKIVRLTPFGAFAEVIPGIDGLIHISQIANRKIGKPADVLTVGEEVEAKVIELNYETKKVGLSIRALIQQEPASEEVAEEATEEVAVETVAEEATAEATEE